MIGRLTGEVAHIADDHVLLDVGGVGYVVFCSSRTLGSLPPVGEGARLYTEMLVREDLMQLFGFPSMAEREWHRLLTTVQGVGAKVSLGSDFLGGCNDRTSCSRCWTQVGHADCERVEE